MIHAIIKEERRVSTKERPRGLAQSMNNDLRTLGVDANGRPKCTVTSRPPQLHMMGTRIDSMDNIEYAASWDGRAPYVEVLKGDIASIKMAYAGWPMVTKAEWDAAHPVEFP